MSEENTQILDQQPEPEKVTVVVEHTPLQPKRPRKVYAGMWGPLEIGAVGVGAMVLVAAAMVYFFFVVPSNRELSLNKTEADRLDAEVMSANSKWGDINNSQTRVDALTTSLDDFESRVLPAAANGQGALYQRVNALISGYGLINTSGPDYSPLDSPEQSSDQQTSDEKGHSKFRSLYPGVYVSMTVEGPYQNLRRFLREIETGSEFIVISTVELAPSDSEAQPKQQQQPPVQPNANRAVPTMGQPFPVGPNQVRMSPGQPTQLSPRQMGKMHGELVSLHIELAAYFRRPNFVPQGGTQ